MPDEDTAASVVSPAARLLDTEAQLQMQAFMNQTLSALDTLDLHLGISTFAPGQSAMKDRMAQELNAVSSMQQQFPFFPPLSERKHVDLREAVQAALPFTRGSGDEAVDCTLDWMLHLASTRKTRRWNPEAGDIEEGQACGRECQGVQGQEKRGC